MKRPILTALLALAGLLPVAADLNPPGVRYENVPYTGRLTFVRTRFTPTRWGPGNYIWGLDLKWNHDYPRGENHLMKILKETTTIDPNMEGSNILEVDDPDFAKYPIAYLCEVGFWNPTEEEVRALRAYLLKGGFVIVDDFVGFHWDNFSEQMRRVLPQGRIVKLEGSHPIFDSFFKVDPYAFAHPNYRGFPVEYHGVFEDNDPSKRLMMIINYNHDIGEYWEWSDTGLVPIELSNEAYKLGVNYMVYALTH